MTLNLCEHWELTNLMHAAVTGHDDDGDDCSNLNGEKLLDRYNFEIIFLVDISSLDSFTDHPCIN
jgi:hypothetical protein